MHVQLICLRSQQSEEQCKYDADCVLLFPVAALCTDKTGSSSPTAAPSQTYINRPELNVSHVGRTTCFASSLALAAHGFIVYVASLHTPEVAYLRIPEVQAEKPVTDRCELSVVNHRHCKQHICIHRYAIFSQSVTFSRAVRYLGLPANPKPYSPARQNLGFHDPLPTRLASSICFCCSCMTLRYISHLLRSSKITRAAYRQ